MADFIVHLEAVPVKRGVLAGVSCLQPVMVILLYFGVVLTVVNTHSTIHFC